MLEPNDKDLGGATGGDGSGDASGQDEVTQRMDLEGAASNLEEDYAAVHKVFAQEMLHLHEKIINYAMWDEDGALCGKNVGNLRLVDKSWLVSVSKVLRQCQEPLFKLRLDKDNVPSGDGLVEPVEEGVPEKMLDKFVTVFGRRIEDDEPYPSIRLRILEDFFEFENFDSLYNFLQQFGHGVLEVIMKIPRNGGSLPCFLGNVALPILKQMTVEFTDKELGNPPNDSQLVPSSNNVTFLLQSLLYKNEVLEKLEIRLNKNYDTTPTGLQYIVLPSSITKLNLSCIMKGRQLEILGKSTLPHLTTLTMMVTNTIYPEGLVNRILDNVRTSLRQLELSGLIYEGPPNLVNWINFPVMEKLEKLSNWSINWELESNIVAIDQYFPKLKTLQLYGQTRSMLQKWASGSPAKHVHSFELELVNDNFQELSRGFSLPITLEDMQSVHLAFPNLKDLTLTLTGAQTCGLKYMFMEMGQLEKLSLFIAECELVESSDFWDSILTGMPLELVCGMQTLRDFWKRVELLIEDLPSIRMLKELKSLSLTAVTTDQETPINGESPVLSDLTFIYAFMKMPNLKRLYFKNIVKVSDETLKAWKDEERMISYTA